MSTATTHSNNKPSSQPSLRGGTTKQSTTLVPAIRFKEFDEKWDKQLLGNIVSKVGSGSTPSGGVQVYQKTGIPFIRSQNVTGNELVLDETHISESINLKMKGSIVRPNDILLNITGGSIGRTCVVPSDFDIGNVNQHVCIIRLKSDYTPRFLQPFLASHKGQKLLYQGMTGSGREGINFQSIRLFKLNLPSLPEQQKIASFLSAVDEKIQQLTKKKALLEDYKKGVMQQLFSGQLRFKDENGNPYPDWEEKIFSDLYSFHTTNSLSRDKLNYESGSVYNIHYGDIHTKFKTAFKLNEEYIPFLNDDVDLSKIKTDSYCKNGDLVMADASEDYADIGKTIELIDLKDENVLAGLHTFLARPITSKTTIGFFSVLLKSWSMRKQIMVIAQGTKVLSLSTKRVGKLKLKLPVIEEQQKIATYLSSIDAKIEAVTHQITQTQTFKKGLLQQMFVAA